MSKMPSRRTGDSAAGALIPDVSAHTEFEAILELIEAARARAVAAVNTTLIDLYWSIGETISRRIASAGWGRGTVEALARYIQLRHPGMQGYSAQNLWRMRQFYEAYCDQPILSPLVRELSWSHNLLILGKCKRPEEREFYLRLAREQQWSSREKDHEVIEYALSRALSPALVAEYQTRLPDKKLLQAKLHEFYALAASQVAAAVPGHRGIEDAEQGP